MDAGAMKAPEQVISRLVVANGCSYERHKVSHDTVKLNITQNLLVLRTKMLQSFSWLKKL